MRIQRKKPAFRLFTGISGSPLSKVIQPPAQIEAKPLPAGKDTVLVHYCFNQEADEKKREWCPCKTRISREDAIGLVEAGRADWLIVKNARAKTGVSQFRRAIVVRSAVLA